MTCYNQRKTLDLVSLKTSYSTLILNYLELLGILMLNVFYRIIYSENFIIANHLKKFSNSFRASYK